MLAGREVDPLHQVELGQDLERPEDGRPAHPEPPRPGGRDEVRRGEVARLVCDQSREASPRFRGPEVAAIKGGEEGVGIDHGPDDSGVALVCRDWVSVVRQGPSGADGALESAYPVSST